MYGNQIANSHLTDDELIVRRVKKQRSKLFGCAPGAHQLMGFLPIKVSKKIATYATDGRIILVNRTYAESLSDLETRGVILHESAHIALKHHIRMALWKKRCGLPERDAHECWNIGSDYRINGDLMRSENYGRDFTLPDNVLWDELYSNCDWPVEKICNDMLSKGWTPTPKGKEPGEDDEGDSECDGEDESGGGDGDGEGGDNATPTNHGCGEILVPEDLEGDSQEAKDAIEKEEQSIDRRVAEAAMLERQIGQGKGGMFDKIFKSTGKTASSEHIRHFLKKNFSHVRSYKRPNRRFLHKKIYLPSKIKTPHTLYACIDSSASMGRDDFEKCRKNLVRWSKDLGLSLIRVAYVDTEIHMNPKTNEPWYDMDLKNGRGADAMELDIYGGGGTGFDPIFDYIKKNNEDVGGLVYFTDGYGSVSDKSPNFPVLWITTGKAPEVYGHYDDDTKLFGKVVHI